MYCPQCATDNLEGASFCRGCGANISLVSQALTGSLPAAVPAKSDEDFSHHRRRSRELPSVEKGIKNIFMGVAFLLVALGAFMFARNGHNWWFWLLIPAFFMLSGGLSEIVRFRMSRNAESTAAPGPTAMPAASTRPAALPRRNTAELIQPPSVTEGTTRHLGDEMQTRHLETPVESKPKKV
jgi:hypothetical protein